MPYILVIFYVIFLQNMALLSTLEAEFRIARDRKDPLRLVYKKVANLASKVEHPFAPIDLNNSTVKKIKEAVHALLTELKAVEGWE